MIWTFVRWLGFGWLFPGLLIAWLPDEFLESFLGPIYLLWACASGWGLWIGVEQWRLRAPSAKSGTRTFGAGGWWLWSLGGVIVLTSVLAGTLGTNAGARVWGREMSRSRDAVVSGGSVVPWARLEGENAGAVGTLVILGTVAATVVVLLWTLVVRMDRQGQRRGRGGSHDAAEAPL